MPATPVDVQWELASDEAFTKVRAHRTHGARPEFAQRPRGGARASSPAASTSTASSPTVSAARSAARLTAPAAGNRNLKFAFVSCQSWHAGFYTAYRHLAGDAPRRDPAPRRLHLRVRDRPGRRAAQHADPRVGAALRPRRLDQYRQRYALYKTDPDLQAAHAVAPFVVTWDDHEVVNNYADLTSPDGARRGRHFLVRRANAYRAYWENMPLRPLHQPKGKDMQLYRRFRYGDLVEFNVLDTRQYRSAQVTGNDRFLESRTIMGAAQEQWLLDGLSASPARWNVLAQQVLMGQLDSDPGSAVTVGNDSWDGYAANRIRVVDAIEQRKISNPVVLCGDVHRHQASHVKGDYRKADAKVVAPEFTCSSISSAGDGTEETPNAANLYAANPHLRMTTSQRGYVTCTVTPDEWRTDYRVVPYITRPDAPVSTRASYVVSSGNPEMEAAWRRIVGFTALCSPSPPSAAPPSACPAARTTQVQLTPSVERLEILRCIGFEQLRVSSHNTTADHQYGDLFLEPTGPLQPSRTQWSSYTPVGADVALPIRVRVAPDAPVGDYERGYRLGDQRQASTPVKVVSDPATQCVPHARMTATATSLQGTDDASKAVDGDPATIAIRN